MTEAIFRKYGYESYEVIIQTDSYDQYKAAVEFARMLIDHEKPVADNNVGSKWIPVTERMPEDGAWVISVDECGMVHLDKWLDGTWMLGVGVIIAPGITHWMPLPEPPKEE